MTSFKERAVGATRLGDTPPPTDKTPLYTRYCAAPRPSHPLGEPRFVHTMLIATWLGRLVDPLPHKEHQAKPGPS